MEVITEKPTKDAVPEGYKLTEVGVIPEDWEMRFIKDLARIGTGAKNTEDKISDGKFPFFVRSSKVERINSYSFDGEAVLTAGDGVNTGKIFHYIDGKFDYHQRVYKISNFDNGTDGYYFHLVFSQYFYERVMGMTAKSSVDSVRMEMIADMMLPFPTTLKEQRAIAETLSDVDALIAELDALIEKKQQIKKGAMQQLLTGKKRLPGFDGEWEEKSLEEIGNTYNGLSGKRGADFGDGNHPYIPFLNVMNNSVIDTSHFDTVKIKAGESQSTAEKGDLFFNTSSETPEEVGMCSVLLEEVNNLHLNSFCFGFRLFEEDEIDPIFLAYYFRSQYGRNHIKGLAQGSTRYNLSKRKFINIEIDFPSFKEQKAIAQILSDMDAEIQALQAKREKYQQIKQGMMQELLTGKTRLI